MSYILDALRKADEERERGTVPSVHAQPSFSGGTMAESAPRMRPRGWIGGGVVAALLLVGATWYLATGRNATDLPGRSLASAAPAVVTTPALAPAPSPAPAPTATAIPLPAPNAPAPAPAPPLVAATTPSGTPPAAAVSPPAAATTTAPLPLEPIRRTTPPPKPAADKKPTTAADNAAGPTANAANTTGSTSKPPVEAAASRIYRLDQLPPDVRRQLPTLSIAGARYSPTPAERILIVNGQVLHEGDKITPDVVLQQIKPKGAVLQFRDYRYEISF